MAPSRRTSPFEQDLDRNAANYTPLTPLTFLTRTAAVYPDRTAVIHGATRYSWRQFSERCHRLAGALAGRGIGQGDTVAVLLPNIPAMLEAHYGVPMIGAVLNTINYRLDSDTVAFILGHGEAKVLITDREFSAIVKPALQKMAPHERPIVIDVDDPNYTGPGERLGMTEYEAFLLEGAPDHGWSLPADEWQAISLNYTSGTTGNPKGVVYHHRGAYLNAVGNALVCQMQNHPVYLWTLPMFHCNGWCFTWTNTAMAGVNVCLRRVEPRAIFDAIADHGVTYLCGAPIVMNMLINATAEQRRSFAQKVTFNTAAAPPPPSVLQAMEALGIEVTHLYGLTETYGPATVCAWKEEWDALPAPDKAAQKARQGVRYQVLEGVTVMDPATMQPVPADGLTMGEVFFRGNIVMKGYLKNKAATDEAFAGGWFHSGDLGVMHPDGYIALKDRSKDIIISGGENISSLEVEQVIYRHPAVFDAAVVARPDDKWGETPCAFIELKPGTAASEQEIIQFCRERMAHFKCPRTVVFEALPKTSTGKIQKFVLRDRAKAL